MKIEHLGIAVSDLDAAKQVYEDLSGMPAYKEEVVESEGVRTVFFDFGESKVELLEATREDSPIAKFLEKNGPGLHHVAFHVEDIQAKLDELKNKGYRLIHEVPKDGADGKQIAFLHPKSGQGVLIELCADR